MHAQIQIDKYLLLYKPLKRQEIFDSHLEINVFDCKNFYLNVNIAFLQKQFYIPALRKVKIIVRIQINKFMYDYAYIIIYFNRNIFIYIYNWIELEDYTTEVASPRTLRPQEILLEQQKIKCYYYW